MASNRTAEKGALEIEIEIKQLDALQFNEQVAKLQASLLQLKTEDAPEQDKAQLQEQLQSQQTKATELQAEREKQEQQLKNHLIEIHNKLQHEAKANESLRAELARATAANEDDRKVIDHLKNQVHKLQSKRLVNNFNQVWNDAGTKSKVDLGINRPVLPEGYVFFGDVADQNHNHPTFAVVVPDDPAMFAAPTGYDLVWKDSGTGAKADGSLWVPRAPANYVAIGCVGQRGYDVPNVAGLRCVRSDLVKQVTCTEVWSDRGLGAKMDCSIWKINNGLNTFVAVRGYDTPQARFTFDY